MNAVFRSPILRFAAVAVVSLLASMQTAQAAVCSATASGIDLGKVDVLGNMATTSSGTISITCGSILDLLGSKEIWVHLGTGRGGASGGSRSMISPTTGTPLHYELYQDASHQVGFGGENYATGGSELYLPESVLLGLLSNKTVNIPVYVRVTGGQTTVEPGKYRSEFSAGLSDVKIMYKTCQLLGILCTTETLTTSFGVEAEVAPDCLVTAEDLDFGSVGLLDQDVEATSSIHVTCTAGTTYDIGLGYGLAGGGADERRMRSPTGHVVEYELYQDKNLQSTWGLKKDGLDMTKTGLGAEQRHTVYGKVPVQPTPPPGQYTDHVVVTVTY